MKMSSSEMGPAVMPSGGLVRRCLYSWKRRRLATAVVDILWAWGTGCVVVEEGRKMERGWMVCREGL